MSTAVAFNGDRLCLFVQLTQNSPNLILAVNNNSILSTNDFLMISPHFLIDLQPPFPSMQVNIGGYPPPSSLRLPRQKQLCMYVSIVSGVCTSDVGISGKDTDNGFESLLYICLGEVGGGGVFDRSMSGS